MSTGCSDAAAPGPSDQVADGPYRHRVLDQLDLPQAMFPGWEVVDAVAAPDPRTEFDHATGFVPAKCAADAAPAQNAHKAAFGGSQWTGSVGIGPDHIGFTVSIYANAPNPLRDIVRYIAECDRMHYQVDFGTVTRTLATMEPPVRGSFEDTAGFHAQTMTRSENTVAPLNIGSALLVGRSRSLTMTVTFTNRGELDRRRTNEIWRLATAKFDRTG